MTDKLKVFVLGHADNLLDNVKPAPYLVTVNLNKIPVDKFQRGEISESRIFLSDITNIVHAEYYGFFTYRWSERFPERIELQRFHEIDLKPDHVYTTVYPNWYSNSLSNHHNIGKYLDELSKVSNLPIINNGSVFCQQFICHKDVYIKFQEYYKHAFQHFYNRYGFTDYQFTSPGDRYNRRMYGLLCERFTMLYFSCMQERGLQVVNIPFK